MSTVDVTDAASPQNVTLPPIDASPANDVEINDVEGGTATENAKKKRTRRKPHGKKNDVKNVKNEAQENAADEGIATDEPLEQNGDEEKPKKKRNRKKPTNPKSAGLNEVDRAEPVNEPQQEGVVVAEKNRKPRNPRSRNSSRPFVENATDEGSNQPEQINGSSRVAEGQDGVAGEKKKKTRRPPRNKKVVKTENDHEVVDGPNAGAKPPATQVKISNQRTGSPAKKVFIPKPVVNNEGLAGSAPNPSSRGPENFSPQVRSSSRSNNFRGNQGPNGNQNQFGNQSQMRQGNSGPNRGNGFGQNKNNGTNNRNMFVPHISANEVQHGLEKGSLVEGIVRINPKNYKDAFISSPSGITADILVNEVFNRNRALEGDLVAVALNDRSEWRVLNENVIEMMETDENVKKIIDKYDANRGDILEGDNDDGDETDDVIVEEIIHLENGKEISRETMPKQPHPPPQQQQQQQQHQRPNFVNRQNSQQRIKSLNQDRRTFSLDLVMKLPKWEQYVQRTGRVVAIMERNHSRKAAGHLEVFPDGNPNHALFRPTDNRIPRMKIPKESCPQDFWIRSEDYKEYLFVAEIVKWDMVNFALGQLVNTLGKDSDIEARTQAILLENDVDTAEFTEEVTRSLPDLPFIISEEEIRMRRDFRSECVFTVDPLTARDLDDALSVEHLGSGRYRVGVHIADVSHFVKELTSLDHVASKRATTVYMVQTIVPMLPRLLCENLCSLNPGVDRLTFSVEWIISETGEIESEWFGRSVIKSCVKLAYEHAQNMIDEPDREWLEEELPPIEKAWTARIISQKINMLQKIAVNLRKKRVDSGALRIDQPKICFQLDKETWMPKGYRLYEHRDSNRLIEEFMLLANMSVAKKLYETFPDLALLRCHPPPPMHSLQKVIKMLKPYHIPLDGTNSKTLQASFNNFRASVLAQDKEDKSKKGPATEGRKANKNDNFGKLSDKKETSGTNKLTTVNIPNVVDNLSAEIGSIKLEERSPDTNSSNHSDRITKSEVARANLSDGHCVAKTSRKLYALPEPPRERLAECKFQVLMSLCAKPMKNAIYFCADNKPVHECRHYALSVDLYTHFTSPIRRYPDIMVHRLLDAALKNEKPAWLPEHVSAISSNCNKKKLIAKRVSEKSDELFLTMFVNACGPLTVNAMVLQVNDVSVDCLLLDMAVTKRVYFDELDDLKSYHFTTNKGKKVMELKWKEVIQKKQLEEPEKSGSVDTVRSTSSGTTTSTESSSAATVTTTTEGANASGETGSAGSAKPDVEKVFVQKLQLFSRVVLTLKEKTSFEFCAVLNPPLN